MPRVNRDMQRRMAARRERDRRRPGERRYRFATPQTDEALLEQEGDVEDLDAETATAPRAAAAAVASSRGGVRATPKPFSAYSTEYAYVATDLRRVALVIGGLLLALIILYFLLPAQVR